MINPDNTIKGSPSKGSERTAERPDGKVDPKKFQEVYSVQERKPTKDEDEGDSEELKSKKKKGTSVERESSLGDGKEAVNKPVSLFDLANQDSGSQERNEEPPQAKKESLFTLASESQTKSKNTNFVREEPDLSQVNPHVYQKSFTENVFTAEKPEAAAPTKNIQEIIDKIVGEVYKLEKSGETSTIIMIDKGPLKNVSVKISEFDSAAKQLNITIDNLPSEEVKLFMDRSQDLLTKTLERIGYQVQQFVTTTQIENPRFDSRGEQNRQGSREQNDKRDGQEQPDKERSK